MSFILRAVQVLAPVLATLQLAACAGVQGVSMQELLAAATSPTQQSLDEPTIAAGLKEALRVGTENAVQETSRRDGFLGNALIRLVLPEELEKTTMELARRIASRPPIANRLNKVMIYKGMSLDLETALQFLTAGVFITVSSEDHKEAIRSFVEKRPPVFKDE